MNCKALVACEKVIIDKEGAHSLVNVLLNASIKLQELQAGQEPRDINVPKNAVAPTQWWIYTLWEPLPKDVGQSFVQVYEVYWPDGEKLVLPPNRLQLPFVQQNEKFNQTSFYIGGFPVGQEGKIRIATWLESETGQIQTQQIETFIRIEHLSAKDEPKAEPFFSSFSRPR
jgi:hypothetical protein